MFGPGAYRPDPTEGITTTANLPPPEIVSYSRIYTRQGCPHCGHLAYRRREVMCGRITSQHTVRSVEYFMRSDLAPRQSVHPPRH